MIDQPINGDGDIIKDSTNVWYKGKCVTTWVEVTDYSSDYSDDYA